MVTQSKIERMSPRKANEHDDTTFLGRFAARLKSLREFTGMDHEKAAIAITKAGYEVTVSTIYRWEQGRTQPHVDAFPAISTAYSVSIRSILPAK